MGFEIENGVLKKYYEENGVTDVVIPDRVTSIGSGAFHDCTSLTSITIPNSVTKIDWSAFSNCTSLTSITIPDSVTYIAYGAFSKCHNISTINVSVNFNAYFYDIQDTAWYKKYNGDFIILGAGLLKYKGCDTNVVIPSNVTSIVPHAFEGCSSLTNITIPDSVTSIGGAAFRGCTSLTSIVIPDSVTFIGDSAFGECSSLTNITIPDSVTKIGKSAFEGCSSLTNITIPDSVTEISERAFLSCKSLSNITIPDSVTSIGEYAFLGCKSLRSIKLPVSMKKLSKKAFIKTFVELLDKYDSENKNRYIYYIETIISFFKENIDVKAVTTKMFEVFADFIVENSENLSNEQLETFFELAKKRKAKNAVEKLNKLVEMARKENSSEKTDDSYPEFRSIFHEKDLDEKLLKYPKAYTDMKKVKLADGSPAPEYIVKCAVVPYLHTDSLHLEPNADKAAELLDKQSFLNFLDSIFSKYGELWTMPLCHYSTDDSYPEFRSIFNEVSLNEKLLQYPKAYKDMKHVKLADGSPAPEYIVKCAVVPYLQKWGLHLEPNADKAAELLDKQSLWDYLESIFSKYGNLWAMPLCHYSNETQSKQLINSDKISYDDMMLNSTKASMIYQQKNYIFPQSYSELTLLDYAAIHNTTIEKIQEITGISGNTVKFYDLGSKTVKVALNDELQPVIIDCSNGKTSKSIPKKGADTALYEKAVADFKFLKADIKELVKRERHYSLNSFLKGYESDYVHYMECFKANPAFRMLDLAIVHCQGQNTFIMTENGAVDCNGNPYEIDKTILITTAHPMEMNRTTVKAWQKYLSNNNIKQPFEQMWEPVIDSSSIKYDRYKGIKIPFYKFRRKDAHGIHINTNQEYHRGHYCYCVTISFDDCNVDENYLTTRYDDGRIADYDDIEITSFKYKKYTRQVNHIVSLLDNWTIVGRIMNDDCTIGNALDSFTLAQILNFIDIAASNNCINVQAVLLDYRLKNFPDYDGISALDDLLLIDEDF